MRKFLFILSSILLISLAFYLIDSRESVGEASDPQAWFWKAGFTDYCPNGLPDFDQKQDGLGLQGPFGWQWTHCGPTAVLNCIWWFDSKLEPNPIDPRPFYPGPGNPLPNDGFPFISKTNNWDDHDTNNVFMYLMGYGNCMKTNVAAQGTNIVDMKACIDTMIRAFAPGSFTCNIYPAPPFDFCANELTRGQDVILLLGFYVNWPPPDGPCCRVGGHYVTMAGVDLAGAQVAFSDPYMDAASPSVLSHNDASVVSHDIYNAALVPPGMCEPHMGIWMLQNYPGPTTWQNFFEQNGGAQCYPSTQPQQVYTIVEQALVICPTEIDTCEYYKLGYLDFAPNGMPDFDQKQGNWWSQQTGNFSWCGPVALANCLWWFDSKFEPNPVDPRPFYPAAGHMVNDHYALVSSYSPIGGWDDHDTNNVVPFTNLLGPACAVDVFGPGTTLVNLRRGVNNWLASVGLPDKYTANIVLGPSFEQIRDSVLSSQDVILLLGFYELGPTCWRLGGHYVTAAGVCTTTTDICISDPMFDANEGEPPPGTIHGSTIHNDASMVSGPHYTKHHDRYNLAPNQYPCPSSATWMFTDYPNRWLEDGIFTFEMENPIDTPYQYHTYTGGPIVVLLDAALIICPAKPEQPDTCEYFKPRYLDYVPNGMPDFDQKQYNWVGPPTGGWSHCGPVAMANCLWWFDSKFEPNPVDPRPFYPAPGMPPNNGFNLIKPYGPWDDHDPANVQPFVDSLALYFGTNALPAPYGGTNVMNIPPGFTQWLKNNSMQDYFTINIIPGPPWELIRDEVKRSQDVILLLGFYEQIGQECLRLGGHYVTAAGVCSTEQKLCISDPYFDRFEGEPPAGSAHPAAVHNDAYNISGPHGTIIHDLYPVLIAPCPPAIGMLQLPTYPSSPQNIANFFQMNFWEPNWYPYQGGSIVTMIDWAIVICPCEVKIGDANNDGTVNVSDAVWIINYVFAGGSPPQPYAKASGDANNDGVANVSDAVYIINYVFAGGNPPPTCLQWLNKNGPPLR